jgi:hypothetical protein
MARIYRSARTGRFVTKKYAATQPKTMVVNLPAYDTTVSVSSQAEKNLLLKADKLRAAVQKRQQDRSDAK